MSESDQTQEQEAPESPPTPMIGRFNNFDPSLYMGKVSNQDYLNVKYRLVWLRDVDPDAKIHTELVKDYSFEQGTKVIEKAIFKAHVIMTTGGEATGYGSETSNDFRDYLEKAETKAVGRALAALGFGTQFADDFSDGGSEGRPVDSPGRNPNQTAGQNHPNPSRPPQQGQRAGASTDQSDRPTQEATGPRAVPHPNGARTGTNEVDSDFATRLRLDKGEHVRNAHWVNLVAEANQDLDKWRMLLADANRVTRILGPDESRPLWYSIANNFPHGPEDDLRKVAEAIYNMTAKNGALNESIEVAIAEREIELGIGQA